MTNDFGIGQQEDFLPPHPNSCYAEDWQDLLLMKQKYVQVSVSPRS